MDMDTWSKGDIHELSKNFIMVKLDIDSDTETARKYGIRAIPEMKIVDPSGNVIDNVSGYQNMNAMTLFMKGYPEEITEINTALTSLESVDEPTSSQYLELGIAYQKISGTLSESVRRNFISQSFDYFTKAKKAAEKEGNTELASLSDLLSIANQLFLGKPDKVIKKLIDKDELLDYSGSNMATANYLVYVSYSLLENQKEAEKYLNAYLEFNDIGDFPLKEALAGLL